MWDNNNSQDYHLSVSPQPHSDPNQHSDAGGSRGTPAAAAAGKGGGSKWAKLAADDSSASSARSSSSSSGGIIPSAAIAAAASTPVSTFSRRAETAQGAVGTVLRMLESLRTCAIGDGCGFISPEALYRAEQAVLHGANAPAQEDATAAEAAGQMVFLVPQQPVAGLPVSLYLNKARMQDSLRRAPSMCLQVGFNSWSIGVQKVGGGSGRLTQCAALHLCAVCTMPHMWLAELLLTQKVDGGMLAAAQHTLYVFGSLPT